MDDPAYLAPRAAGEDLDDPDLEDPQDTPPPEVDAEELAAEADRITAELAREAALLAGGVRGCPGRRTGCRGSRSAGRPGSGRGCRWIPPPGSAGLARFAEDPAGPPRQLTGTTALRRTKGRGAVLVALAPALVLRSLCYTVTASRPAVTAAA